MPPPSLSPARPRQRRASCRTEQPRRARQTYSIRCNIGNRTTSQEVNSGKDYPVESVLYHLAVQTDSYGRNIGHTLTRDDGKSTLLTVTTGYAPDGRIGKAGLLDRGEMREYNYSYLEGSNLLSDLAMSCGMHLIQQYEENFHVIAPKNIYKKMIKKFCILILGVLLLTSCGEELPRHILGDYYLCQTKIDLSVFYLVEELRDGENKEAAARVGISGQYIYWETDHCHKPGEIIDPGHKPFCHPTIFRIDTQEKKEVRVDEIPEHVKMYPAEEFYYMLEEGHIIDFWHL